MRRFRGAGEVAVHLREDGLVVVVGEAPELRVAGLRFERGPVDGSAVETRGGARLEATHIEAKRAQLVGETVGCLVAGAAALKVLESDMAEATQEGARGEDNRARRVGDAESVNHTAADLATGLLFEQQSLDGPLFDVEVGERHQEPLHLGAVDLHVGLGTRGAHGRPLLGVEVFEVDGGAVGDASHDAAQRVDFADELPLCLTTDGRVAGHVADGIDVHGQEQGPAPHDGERVSRLAAGVSAADDDGVISGGVVEHGSTSAFGFGCADSLRPV